MHSGERHGSSAVKVLEKPEGRVRRRSILTGMCLRRRMRRYI